MSSRSSTAFSLASASTGPAANSARACLMSPSTCVTRAAARRPRFSNAGLDRQWRKSSRYNARFVGLTMRTAPTLFPFRKRPSAMVQSSGLAAATLPSISVCVCAAPTDVIANSKNAETMSCLPKAVFSRFLRPSACMLAPAGVTVQMATCAAFSMSKSRPTVDVPGGRQSPRRRFLSAIIVSSETRSSPGLVMHVTVVAKVVPSRFTSRL
mmetsp:Transcript_44018/g.138341  ORF Transcript_44018/g.138341 Transcript_44018/m.138341 type:complete len:211 (-) Transcript_44018:456-1088(-)